MLIPSDNSFFAGILSTLESVSAYEPVYRQIVATSDVGSLCRVARSLGTLERSGLVRFGYAIADSDTATVEELRALPYDDRQGRWKRVTVSAKLGDPLARSVLMRDYEVVVKTIIKRKFGWFLSFPGRHLEYQDLLQEGRYMVLRSLESFEPDREGASFRSLVDLKVHQHLHEVIRKREGAVLFPQSAYYGKHGNILFTTVESVDDEGNDRVEQLPDDGWDDAMIDFVERMEFSAKVQSLMWFLPDREHFMLRCFFGFDAPAMTKAAMAKDFGMTSSAVGVIIDGALLTLRNWITTGNRPKRPRKPDLKRLARVH